MISSGSELRSPHDPRHTWVTRVHAIQSLTYSTLSLSSAWTRMRVEVKMIVSFIFLYTNKMQDYSHNGRIRLLTHKGKITHTMAGRITHTMAGLLTMHTMQWQDCSHNYTANDILLPARWRHSVVRSLVSRAHGIQSSRPPHVSL